jgi:hypothetical protein
MLWKELDGRFVDPAARYQCQVVELPDVFVYGGEEAAGAASGGIGAAGLALGDLLGPVGLGLDAATLLSSIFGGGGDPLGALFGGAPPVTAAGAIDASGLGSLLSQIPATPGTLDPGQVQGALQQYLPKIASALGDTEPQALAEVLQSGQIPSWAAQQIGAQFEPQLLQQAVGSGMVSAQDAPQFLQAFGLVPTPPAAPAAAPLAPADTQVPLPQVDVTAAPPPVEPLALAGGAPSALGSIFGGLNPVGTAEAGGLPPINVPSIATPGGAPATATPTASSSLVSGLGAPTGAAPVPSQAPPSFLNVDLNNPAAGLGVNTFPDANAPVSGAPAVSPPAPPPAAPPASVTGPVATPPTTTTPITTTSTAPGGEMGTQAEADAQAKAVADAEPKSGFQAFKDWAKDNSGLFTLAGLGLPLVSSLFQKTPAQENTATQAANAALGPASAAFGNAQTAQGPANQAFSTAALGLLPAATTNVASTIAGASPIISGQTALSEQEQAAAIPLLNAATTGVLPPGESDAIAQALGANRAAITSRYGDLGLAGSNTEALDIGSGAATIIGQIPGILNQLVTQGASLAQGSTQAGGEALSGQNTILQAIQGLNNAIGTETNAAGGVTSAAGGVTQAANASTSADTLAANANLQVADLQLKADQELQTALQNLARNLTLSQISPSTVNVTA